MMLMQLQWSALLSEWFRAATCGRQAAEAAFDDLQPVIATEASVEQSWVGHEGQAQAPGVFQPGQGEVSGREHICHLSILAVQGAGMRTQNEFFLALSCFGVCLDDMKNPDTTMEARIPRIHGDINRDTNLNR